MELEMHVFGVIHTTITVNVLHSNYTKTPWSWTCM